MNLARRTAAFCTVVRLFSISKQKRGAREGRNGIYSGTDSIFKVQKEGKSANVCAFELERRWAYMDEQKKIAEELTADIHGLEVLLRIYANTYHKKRLEEVTEREWTEQREALRCIIKSAEAMKLAALEWIGGGC